MIIHAKSPEHAAESAARYDARAGQPPQVSYDPFQSYTSEELAYLEYYQKESWRRERRTR